MTSRIQRGRFSRRGVRRWECRLATAPGSERVRRYSTASPSASERWLERRPWSATMLPPARWPWGFRHGRFQRGRIRFMAYRTELESRLARKVTKAVVEYQMIE